MNENIFDGIADIYDKYRPSYPSSLFTYLCADIGINSHTTIADIGSGTGILSKKLLSICSCVWHITIYSYHFTNIFQTCNRRC